MNETPGENRTTYYRAYGLTFESAFELPELLPDEDIERPDVCIRYGDLPGPQEYEQLSIVRYQGTSRHIWLEIEDIARYCISEGSEIVVDPILAKEDARVRIFLLGSAFTALLYQRGFLALHGSVIETGDGAVALMGHSGVGKSTLAGAFRKRGYRIVADDICAIGFDKLGVPMVFPAYPQVRLWADAVEEFAEDKQNLRKVHPALEKYYLPLSENFGADPVPFRGVYVLTVTDSQDLSLTPLTGVEKLAMLSHNVHRVYLLESMNKREDNIQQVIELARCCHVQRVTRPRDLSRLDELADLIEQDFSQYSQ